MHNLALEREKRDFGQTGENLLAPPELTWQAEGSGFLSQSKDLKGGSGPVRGGAFVLGRSKPPCAEPRCRKGPNRCGAAAELIGECTRWRTGAGVTSPVSTLDAELNDFGAQLAMLGGHAADRDG